jgi:hypothetical protein
MSLSNEFLAKPREASRPAKFPYGPSIMDGLFFEGGEGKGGRGILVGVWEEWLGG